MRTHTKIVFFVAMYFIFNSVEVMGQLPVKAWVEVENRARSLSLKANVENQGSNALTLKYILKLTKKGPAGNSNTIQKGTFVVLGKSITSLSESSMNLFKSDKLIAKLIIYHDKVIVAQDSVVFHGDNY